MEEVAKATKGGGGGERLNPDVMLLQRKKHNRISTEYNRIKERKAQH